MDVRRSRRLLEIGSRTSQQKRQPKRRVDIGVKLENDGPTIENASEDSNSAPKNTDNRAGKRKRKGEDAVKKAKVKREPKRDFSDQPRADSSQLTEAEMHAFDGNDHWVGAHMSIAKGVENAIVSARLYGAQAFALFLKAKMNWTYRPLAEENIARFVDWLPKNGYDGARCLPHGTYLINLANPDPEKLSKSYASFLDDLRRCALLGIKLYNFHPGSTVGECTKSGGCAAIADSINLAHNELKRDGLASPIILLENMAGQGNLVGGSFEDLAAIIAQVKAKGLIGVCIDTAHVFAAGWDIRTRQGFEDMLKDFDRTVGLSYLKAMHLNDSKAALGSFKDRHENLGAGEIGLIPFWCIMNDDRFRHMPLTLETPAASWRVWQGEIQALYLLQGLREDDATGWRRVVDKLSALRMLPKEMEKGNSLAAGGQAAKQALERRASAGTDTTASEKASRPLSRRGGRKSAAS